MPLSAVKINLFIFECYAFWPLTHASRRVWIRGKLAGERWQAVVVAPGFTAAHGTICQRQRRLSGTTFVREILRRRMMLSIVLADGR